MNILSNVNTKKILLPYNARTIHTCFYVILQREPTQHLVFPYLSLGRIIVIYKNISVIIPEVRKK